MTLFMGLAIFVSALLQAATGFGFAIMAIPLLTLLFDPHLVIPLVMCTSFITLCLNIKKVWRQANVPLLKRLLLASLLGVPIGAWVYTTLDSGMMKIVVSIGILFSTLLVMAQRWIRSWVKVGMGQDWVFGWISGVMTAAVGMPGPPIMIVLSARQEQQGSFRATGIMYLFLIYPFSIAILAFSGGIQPELFTMVLTMVPFAFLGMLSGNRLHSRLSPKVFTVLIYVILLSTGFYSLWRNL